jgi:hypothetical protein
MLLIRHCRDFANSIGDANRANSLPRAQAGKAAVIIAGSVSNPMAATVEAGEGYEEKIRLDRGRALEGLTNRHCP